MDLANLAVGDASRIRIRFNRRVVELSNSGMSASDLRALREKH
jgi:hypothetical protein